MRILSSRSVLAVRDLARSTEFYRSVLGFVEDDIKPPGWCFLSRDSFRLMLGECRDEMTAEETGNHSWFVHLLVTGIDVFFDEVHARGGEIISPVANREYGLREFVIRTPDGHRIVVGEPIASA